MLADPPLGHETGAPRRRQLRHAGPDAFAHRAVGRDGHEVGLGEVAIVVRPFLRAHRVSDAGVLVPVARLLRDALAGIQQRALPLDLVLERPAERPDRVHVLHLDLGAERFGVFRAQRHVGVDSERALFHLHVRDANRLQDVAQLVHVGARLLRATEVGPAHDLHQGDAGPVVVYERVVGLVNAPAAAHVDGLAGVLFHVRALDADAEAVHLEHTVDADRLVVLADLIVLRHVRIEVVLAVEQRTVRHRALQRLTDAQRELHRPLAQHGQRAGQPQAHRADVRVGLGAELVLARAEQLRRRGQLDVHLETDHRLPRRGRRRSHARLPPCPSDPTRTRS